MLNRPTISRREPVIALETFRYRGRNYKEGDYLDRRRCRMPHSKLLRLLRKGVCILAKKMSPEKLAEYGFKYCPESPRLKLNRLSPVEKLNIFNKGRIEGYSWVNSLRNDPTEDDPTEDDPTEDDPTEDDPTEDDPTESLEEINNKMMTEFFPEDYPIEDDPTEDDLSLEPTLKHVGGGWYDIVINDKPVNDTGLRKDDAITFRDNYKVGE